MQILFFLIALFLSSQATAQPVTGSELENVIRTLRVICASGQATQAELETGIRTKLRLLGAEGSAQLTSKQFDGAVGYADETIRSIQDEAIRKCMQSSFNNVIKELRGRVGRDTGIDRRRSSYAIELSQVELGKVSPVSVSGDWKAYVTTLYGKKMCFTTRRFDKPPNGSNTDKLTQIYISFGANESEVDLSIKPAINIDLEEEILMQIGIHSYSLASRGNMLFLNSDKDAITIFTDLTNRKVLTLDYTSENNKIREVMQFSNYVRSMKDLYKECFGREL